MSKKLTFIPQLDGLRCIAVGLVIVNHWIPNAAINVLPNGHLGVNIFFVLSGFLITTNLLYSKQDVAAAKIIGQKMIGVFFAKRALRIFPVYYLVLILIYLFARGIYESNEAWYFLYASNFLVFKDQEWQGVLSHFWSLAVEEQFYLVWPFFILWVPFKRLKKFFWAVVILSFLFKAFMIYFSSNKYSAELPFSCFYAFGLGGLLSFHLVDKKEHFKISNWMHWAMNGFFVLIVLDYIYVSGILLKMFFPFYATYLLAATQQGSKGIWIRMLRLPFIRYCGKISYGLYVYHNFIPWLIRNFQGTETKYKIEGVAWLSGVSFNTWQSQLLNIVLLVSIASLSWFLWEKPINNLKARI